MEVFAIIKPMKNKLALLTTVALGLALVFVAGAQTAAPAPTATPNFVPPPGPPPATVIKRNAAEGALCGGIQGIMCGVGLRCKYDGSFPDASGKCVKIGSDVREEARQSLKDFKGNLQQELQMRRQEAQQLIEQKREELKQQIETKREEAKTKIEAAREQLKQKLTTIKDERKKQIVEKLGADIQELNSRRVEHFTNVADKLDKVLANIKSRMDKAEANGKDVTAVKAAITSAESAITAARTAITAQAGEVYTIAVSTEAKLKTDVGVTRQKLQNGLEVVRKALQAAHDAVRNVATTLAQIPRVDSEVGENVETPSTNQ